mgnify:FL=1
MLSIYTYPNNSGYGYIDPNYYGATTPGSETGYFKRITDLKAGTNLAWPTGSLIPTDTVADLITATGLFHKGVDVENGLENISIYSYWNQPLATIDTVLISENITSSDTVASPAATITVDTSDFVDSDSVTMSNFDGTLAELNSTVTYLDVIDATTAALYSDSALSLPIRYYASIIGQAVADINYSSGTPLSSPVKVTLTGLGSAYNGANITFNSTGGSNIQQDRLAALSPLYVKHISGDIFDIHETSALDNSLNIGEFINSDYSQYGIYPSPPHGGGGSTTNNYSYDLADGYNYGYQINFDPTVKITGIQRKDPNGNWVDGLNNAPATTAYQGNPDVLVQNPPNSYVMPGILKTYDGTSEILTGGKAQVKILRGTYLNLADSNGSFNISGALMFPGLGYYVKPVYDDAGTFQLNQPGVYMLSRYDDSFDTEIEDNFPNNTNTSCRWALRSKEKETADLPYDYIEFLKSPPSITKTINNIQYNIQSVPFSGGYSPWTYQTLFNGLDSARNAPQIFANTPATPGFPPTTSSYAWDGTYFWYNTVTYNPGRLILDKLRDILDNNLKETIMVAYKSDGDGYNVRTQLIMWPIEETSDVNNWKKIKVMQVPVTTWEDRAAPNEGTYGWGTLTPSTSVYLANGSEDEWLQSNLDNALSEDKTTTSFSFNVTPDGSGSTFTDFTITSSNAAFDILQTGTIISFNAGADIRVLIQSDASLGSSTSKTFAMYSYSGSVVDWTTKSSVLSSLATNVITTGVNYFTVDSVNDLTYYRQRDYASGGAVPVGSGGSGTASMFNETTQVRALKMDNVAGTTADLGVSIVDSTTGTITLTGSTNHKAINPHMYFGGTQTYIQRTGQSVYVDNAFVKNDAYTINSSTTTDLSAGTLPTFTIGQTNGYINSLGLSTAGRITAGQKMVRFGTVPDTYTPVAPTPAELEDVWDTEDQWTTAGFDSSKLWPSHVTPTDAQIVYNTPTIANTSENGIKFVRKSGYTKWTLDVTYPPMTKEEFIPFNAIAQAAQGQAIPFYFKLVNKDNASILWKDLYTGTTSAVRVKDSIAPGDTTMLVEGYSSNETNAFTAGEVFIDGNNENGFLHTALSGTAANVYGEAKIRVPFPFRNIKTAGQLIYRNPLHAVVTLASDELNYTVDHLGYYRMNVSFQLDGWKD